MRQEQVMPDEPYVGTAVLNNVQGKTLLAGGASVNVQSWGFG